MNRYRCERAEHASGRQIGECYGKVIDTTTGKVIAIYQLTAARRYVKQLNEDENTQPVSQ